MSGVCAWVCVCVCVCVCGPEIERNTSFFWIRGESTRHFEVIKKELSSPTTALSETEHLSLFLLHETGWCVSQK